MGDTDQLFDRHDLGRWLDRIEDKLDRVLQQEGRIMATQADLDAAIAALATEVQAAVAAILAKIPPGIDLSAEVAQINQATTDLTNALAPPPAP